MISHHLDTAARYNPPDFVTVFNTRSQDPKHKSWNHGVDEEPPLEELQTATKLLATVGGTYKTIRGYWGPLRPFVGSGLEGPLSTLSWFPYYRPLFYPP